MNSDGAWLFMSRSAYNFPLRPPRHHVSCYHITHANLRAFLDIFTRRPVQVSCLAWAVIILIVDIHWSEVFVCLFSQKYCRPTPLCKNLTFVEWLFLCEVDITLCFSQISASPYLSPSVCVCLFVSHSLSNLTSLPSIPIFPSIPLLLSHFPSFLFCKPSLFFTICNPSSLLPSSLYLSLPPSLHTK